MKRVMVLLAKLVFNMMYGGSCLLRSDRRDEVLFVSRQTNEPSYDYRELAKDFEREGWTARIHVKKLTKRSLLSYTVHVVKEIWYLSSCKVVILDRYDPVVSLIDFKCEDVHKSDVLPGQHFEFPCEPVVVQIWHAFGAFKKFGFQSIDTIEGHTSKAFNDFSIHRNYSWIICSGEGCRKAFSEAFSYPIERVVVGRRPEYDKLIGLRDSKESQDEATSKKQTILFAPTLRKSKESEHPFRSLYERRVFLEEQLDANLIWSFHPLESGLPAPGDVSDALLQADIVVTDYSSIVYEAYLLGKKVLFYVPDIESYRKSPGLNVDPSDFCKDLIGKTDEGLVVLVRSRVCGLRGCGPLCDFVSNGLDANAETIFDIAFRMVGDDH